MHFCLVYKGLEFIDLKEKNRKQKCDQIKKKIQSRVQKNFKCKSIQSAEKKKQDTQQFQIDGSEKSKII